MKVCKGRFFICVNFFQELFVSNLFASFECGMCQMLFVEKMLQNLKIVNRIWSYTFIVQLSKIKNIFPFSHSIHTFFQVV
jgi:hypothetical protein